MSTPSQAGEGKGWLSAGWVLVSGLLALCIAGAWITAHNYRENVFSSAGGIVLQNQWPESRIAVEFPSAEASRIREGQVAKITVGADKTALRGEIVSVRAKTKQENASMVVIKLVGEPANPAQPAPSAGNRSNPLYLPTGTACFVSIDTTVPPISDDSAAR